MPVGSLHFLAGILFFLYLPAGWLPHPAWACLLLPLITWRPRLWRLLLVAGGCLHAQLAATGLDMTWPVDGERVVAEVLVTSVPALGESGWQFDAQVRLPRHPQWPARPLRIRQGTIAGGPRVGERWQLVLRINAADDPASRRRLLRDHLAGNATVAASALNQRLQVAGPGLDPLRERLARQMADRIADPSAAALLAALAVGVTGEVTPQQWAIFNATGITHLVAISGMHVTFFAMLSMGAARRIWPRISTWRMVPRRELFAAATGVVLALLYALLSGFSVPAQRTVAMLAVFVLARESARCTAPSWSICAALWAVLLLDPMAALSAGFWLSFIAVAAIVLIHGARVVPGAPLQDAVRLQWLATVSLLPVTVAIFGSFSAIGLLANAIAIPVFTFLLVPPVLLATACLMLPGPLFGWIGGVLVDLAGMAATALWPLLAWCAALPMALWRTEAPWTWYLLAPGLVLLVLLPLPLRTRMPALAAVCATFLLREPRPGEGEVWIDLLDVGASTALVMRTHSHLLVWGSGEVFGSGGARFERHVLPVLRAAGHSAVDLWIPGTLSRDVQAALRLGAADRPVTVLARPHERGVPPEQRQCSARSWTWNKVHFQLTREGDDCGLLVHGGAGSIALGGSVLAAQADPRVQLLLLPRAAGTVQRISPAAGTVLLASLSRNEWNSPAWQRQRERLHEAGNIVMSTASGGRVRLKLDAGGIRRRSAHEAGGLR